MQKLAPSAAAKSGPHFTAVKPCGECNLCCTLLTDNALAKPAGRTCAHLQGGQCGIHADKPGECSVFQCFWTLATAMDEAWRPDRCGFILWSDHTNRLIVDVDARRPDAWRREPYYNQLRIWADRDAPHPLEVLVRVRGRMLVVFPETDIDLGAYQPQMSVDSGYLLLAGQRTPYARFVPARS